MEKRTFGDSRFSIITDEMFELYSLKNADYGNSFDKSLDEDGLLVAKIRLQDKMQRFSQLIKNPAQVKSESIRDTLIDLANYSVMTIMWLDERSSKEPGIVCGLHPSYMQDEKKSKRENEDG